MASRLMPKPSTLTSVLPRRPLVSTSTAHRFHPSSSPLPFPSHFLPRTMADSYAAAAATPPNFEFLVVVPDKPGMLEKRLEVRPTHFKNIEASVESGLYKMGGALLDEVPADDHPSSLKFHGSTLVCLAASRDEVLETLKKDIYARTGVWDMEKIQIYPFKCAFRKP